MKSNKGVTLVSLIIYLIGLVIFMAIFETFLNYFYTNVNGFTSKENYEEQYARFTTFITNDINSRNINTVSCPNDMKDDLLSINFYNGETHQYIFTEGKIFYLRIKNNETVNIIEICNKVNNLSNSKVFNYDSEKRQIDINCSINEKRYSDTYFIN